MQKVLFAMPISAMVLLNSACSTPLPNSENTNMIQSEKSSSAIKSKSLISDGIIKPVEKMNFNTKAVSQSVGTYNEEAYLLANSDIKAAVANQSIPNGYSHYVAWARDNEGRIFNPDYINAKIALSGGFNEPAYLAAFPDVAQAVANQSMPSALFHFWYYGRPEGANAQLPMRAFDSAYQQAKITNVTYNEDAYLYAFPAVLNAVIAGTYKNGYEHYLAVGINDHANYMGSPAYITTYQNVMTAYKDGFNETVYLAAFSDIANAVNSGGLYNGLFHYLGTGAGEGRLQTQQYIDTKNSLSAFNEEAYLNAFPDIQSAVNNNGLYSGLQHYINWGIYEERLTNSNYINAKNYVDIEGRYIANRETVSLDFQGKRRFFRFWGSSGKDYKIDLNELTANDVYVKLLNQYGEVVATNDDGNGGLDSKIVYNCTSTGFWQIEVSTWDSVTNGSSTSPTGSFDISLTRM